MMLGSVGLLEWGINVVVLFSVEGGLWDGPFRGRLLKIGLNKVAVLRCKR